MTRQNKDMLENMLAALRPDERAAARTTEPRPNVPIQPQSQGEDDLAAGPFGGFPSADKESLDARLRQTTPGAWNDPRALRRVGLVAVLVVAAFLLGRASVGSVSAKDGASARGSTRRASTPSIEFPAERRAPAEQPRAERTQSGAPDPDAALGDPANRYTVLLITYDDTEANRRLAWESYGALRQAGIEVFRPYGSGGRVLLMAGAAPRQAELDDVLEHVRAARSPRGRRDYDSAYIVPIDNFVRR